MHECMQNMSFNSTSTINTMSKTAPNEKDEIKIHRHSI